MPMKIKLKKELLFGTIILILIAIGIFYLESAIKHGSPANIGFLRYSRVTPLVTQDGIEYQKGAAGFFAKPQASGNYPGVVMIHENRGLRPEIKETANKLAREGYMVLAVNLLDGIAEDQQGAKALTAKFKQDQGIENMRAAVRFLREQGANKIASLGWCFGGNQSLELATSGEKLDATVVYYGTGMKTSTQYLQPIQWPVLGIFGDADPIVPLSAVNDFKASLKSLNIPYEVHIYPGVGHAFANPSGVNYAPNETKDAWEKTLNFLEANLKR